MPPNQAIRADKSIRCSLLAAVGPLIILSWPEALNASRSMRACRMAIRRNDFLCLLSLISRNSPKQLGMVSPELPISRAQSGSSFPLRAGVGPNSDRAVLSLSIGIC